MPIDWPALIVFVLLFALVTALGFVAVHWRRGDLGLLHEWGLAGGRFGTVVTWFLLGGDLYTAYTFIAVPALMFGAGALGFFAVPYTIMVYPFVFLVFPRLWSVARQHGYITAADFVRGRHGNRWLALAVAVTGIVATMPYIALQLVGIQVVIAALGIGGRGLAGRPAAGHRLCDPGRLHLYERAARAGGDRDRQGHPDLDHGDRRDRRHSDRAWRLCQDLCRGAAGEIAAGRAQGAEPRPIQRLRDVGVRLGPGALSLPAFGDRRVERQQPRSDQPQRRLSAGLLVPAGADCAVGLHGDRRRGRDLADLCADVQAVRPEFRGAGADPGDVSVVVRRRRLRRDRDRRAGAGGDHVDRGLELVDAQHLSRIHPSRLHRGAGIADGQDRFVWSSSSGRWCSFWDCR